MSPQNSRSSLWKFPCLGDARGSAHRRTLYAVPLVVGLVSLFITQAVLAKRQASVSTPLTIDPIPPPYWENISINTPDGNSFGNNAMSVAWGDVDGDGDLDIVVGNTLLPSSNQTSQISSSAQQVYKSRSNDLGGCHEEGSVRVYQNNEGVLEKLAQRCWGSTSNSLSPVTSSESMVMERHRAMVASSGSTNYAPYLIIDRPETMEMGHSRAMFSSLVFDNSPPIINQASSRLASTEALSISGPDGTGAQGLFASGGQGYDVYTIVQVDGTTAFEQSPAPQDQKEQQLLPGRTAKFAWSLNPKREGEQSILLTVDLRWVPHGGGREFIERVYSREIVVNVTPQYTTWGSAVQLSAILYNALAFAMGGLATWSAQLVAERIKQRRSVVPVAGRDRGYEQLLNIPRTSIRTRPTRCRKVP